jgi:hypothetical protein
MMFAASNAIKQRKRTAQILTAFEYDLSGHSTAPAEVPSA